MLVLEGQTLVLVKVGHCTCLNKRPGFRVGQEVGEEGLDVGDGS